MKYFLHDSNAFSDEKVTLLYLKFGFEAVGLFFCILEKLALQEQPVNEIVLKSQLNIKKRLEKQLNFMYEIDILSVKNGDVFSKNILKFSEKYQIKKEKTRKRVSEWRDKQEDTKSVTCYKSVRNAPKDKISKVKISKVKEEKEVPAYLEFKNYALSKKSNLDESSLKLKYDSWTENNWKDGNNKDIKNWKSKLLNTIPYLKEKMNGKKTYVETDQKQLSDSDYDNDPFLPPLNPTK